MVEINSIIKKDNDGLSPSFITDSESSVAKKLVEDLGGHCDMHNVECYHELSF